MLAYKLNRQQVDNLCSHLDTELESLASRARLFDHESTLRVITQPTTLDFLKRAARGDYIVYDCYWRVRRIDVDSMRRVAHESVARFTHEHDDNDRKLLALSLTTTVPLLAPHSHRVDVYFYGEADVRLWSEHLRAAVSSLPFDEQQWRNTNLMLHFPTSLDCARAEAALESAIGPRCSQSPFDNTKACILFSKPGSLEGPGAKL